MCKTGKTKESFSANLDNIRIIMNHSLVSVTALDGSSVSCGNESKIGSAEESFNNQGRKRTCKVTLRRVRITLLPCKSNMYYTFRVCVCSLSYPACKVHSPLCTVICGLFGSTTFLHIIPQTAQFSGKFIEHKMCVLIFSTIFVRNTSHCTKN